MTITPLDPARIPVVNNPSSPGPLGTGVTTVTVPEWRERCEIHFSVTCLRHADVMNAWIPIAGLAVISVLVWMLVALDR
jgi:hypothetical protein